MGDMSKVISYMKAMGMKKIRAENFEDKIRVQKAACLLNLMGIKTGYNFSLYIRGPYSPGLTQDIYGHKEELEGMKTDYEPGEREIKALGVLEEASKGLEPAILEIMATFAYIWKGQKKDLKEAMLETKRLKPFYSDVQIAVGTNCAKMLFPPTEAEVRRMKSEMNAWEAAAIADMKY